MARIKRSNTYYGSGNPGDAYNETWEQAQYGQNPRSLSSYGQKGNTFENRFLQKRGLASLNDATNLSDYRKDKIENRSEVLVQRKLNKLGRRQERLEKIQGKDLSRRQRIKLGKGGGKAARLSKRITNRDKHYI